MPNCKTVVPYRGTPEQEAELRQVIAQHKGQSGAAMPVLQKTQRIFGYLLEEALIIVAQGLDLPLFELYGMAWLHSMPSPPSTPRGVPGVRMPGHLRPEGGCELRVTAKAPTDEEAQALLWPTVEQGKDDRGNEVGTAFVAIAMPECSYVRSLNLGTRPIRAHLCTQAASHAFDPVRRYLTGMPYEG